MKKVAFTFAETLTTLTLIGIVSVILIPVLNISITKQKNVAALKRMYSDFSINIQTVLNHANCSSVSCLRKYGKNTSVEEHIKYRHNGAFADTGIIKVVECPLCFAKNSIMPPKMFPFREIGRKSYDANFSAYRYENTSAIAIYDYQRNCITEGNVFFQEQQKDCPTPSTCVMKPVGSPKSIPVCGMVVFDVNGEKTPNLPGKDRFGYYIADEPIEGSYLVPIGYSRYDITNNKSQFNRNGYIKSTIGTEKCKPYDKNGDGYNCTAKIMVNNWKMNY